LVADRNQGWLSLQELFIRNLCTTLDSAVDGDFVAVGWRRPTVETVSVVKSEKPTKLINRDHVAIDLVKHAEKGFSETLM
jgi:hypothetical protein